MKVQIITIGDELLIGQVVDTNSAWMGMELNKVGFEIQEISSVGDQVNEIKKALDYGFKHADVLLLTGGLGPTKDDITKKAMAEYFKVDMVFDESTFNRMQRMFERWGRDLTEAHKAQAYMPANARILTNKMGTAPGMWFDYQGKVAVTMPGVPYEMKYLMTTEVIPRLTEQYPGQTVLHRTICTVGEGEARLAKRIEPFVAQLPKIIKVAYLPGLGSVRIRLSVKGEKRAELQQLLDDKVKELQSHIPEFVYGFDQDTLPVVVGQILLEQHKKLGVAESCTGGYVGHLLTLVPGSSRYFTGGIIAYSNELKVNLLAVKESTLASEGAVSESTVREMLSGCLQCTGAHVGIAVSGIAGPGGGTAEKPVGTIWLAAGDLKRQQTLLLQLGKDRQRNIQYTGVQALNLVRKFLLEG